MLRRVFNLRILIYWLAAAFLLLVFLIHLGTQPSGSSPAEAAAASHSQSFHSIAKNPLYAPHDILGLAFHKVSSGLFAARLSSVVWGVIFALGFFLLAQALFGKLIGLAGSVILVTTPLYLISSRQASAEIMFTAPAVLMAGYTWLCRAQAKKGRALWMLCTISAVLLYVPGIIWWLGGAALFGRRKLAKAIAEVPKPEVYGALAVGLLIIAPLAAAIAGNWQLVKPLALVPDHFSNLPDGIKSIGWMFSAWFFKSPQHSPLIISRLPLLNTVQDVMLIFGVFAMFQAARNKALALMAALLFAVIAASLNHNIAILLLGLPAAAVFVSAGLRYLYIEWRGVFPRNPAAKYLALTLISLLAAVQVLFGIRYALIAWPHSLATKETYVLK